MKQTFEGWTIATKIAAFGEDNVYFMGIREDYSGHKFITLKSYPTNKTVLKNLFKTKEEAISFWKTGFWNFIHDRESLSISPVKIKIDIDVSDLELAWTGM